MRSVNARLVDTFLGAMTSGDIRTAMSCLHPDCVVDEAGGVPFSGEYRGRAGFVELLKKMSADLDATITSVTAHDAGDTVIGKLDITFASRATGRTLSTSALEMYTVVDGGIKHADVYFKDPAAVTALATDGSLTGSTR